MAHETALPGMISRAPHRLNFNTPALIMFNVLFGGFACTKFLTLVFASKMNLAAALMLWHQAVYSNGAFRFSYAKDTLFFLTHAMGTRLSFRYWLARIAQLTRLLKCRNALPSVPGMEFLRRRDGQTLLDFFKTLAFSGVSPPAFALSSNAAS